MTREARDWRAWHREYDLPDSRLAQRLRVVRRLIGEALDRFPPGPIRALSLCAGEGRDLLGVLADHPRAEDVRAPGRALARARRHRRRARAARRGRGVGRRVDDDGLRRCRARGSRARVRSLWQRVRRRHPAHRALAADAVRARRDGGVDAPSRAPDLTTDIRAWFGEAGFEEITFVGSDSLLFGVGAHRLVGPPLPYAPGVTLFRFVGY